MLSLSPLTVLPCSPIELIDAAEATGFDAVGLRLVPVLPTDVDVITDSALRTAIRRRLSETNLQVLDIEVIRIGPATDVDALARTLEYAGELGARNLALTALPRADYKGSEEGPMVSKLAALCELATAYSIKPMIEFMAFRGIATLEDAIRIVGLVDHPNLGICVDALHLHRSGGTPAKVASADPHLIACVQICDAPETPPADLQAEARFGRLLPGDGALPLRPLLQAVSPSVPVSVETPCAAAMQLTVMQRATEAAQRMRALLASAGRA